eukprot:gene18996-22708_t
MAPTATMEIHQDGVAVITVSHPPMNSLHPMVLSALLDSLKTAQADSRVKAIVVTGHKNFSAGFDIPTFVRIQSGAETLDDVNPHLNALLESGPKPTVAAIEGAALGGGCELAMGCNARICTPNAQMGLPELTLGLIPGMGGTQRLPRLVGLQKAMQMILTSKPIKAQEAKKFGLVSQIVPPSDLLATAKAWALDVAAGRRPRVIALEKADWFVPWVMGSPNEVLPMLEMAKKQAQKSGMEHPLLCIDAITEGVVNGPVAGLAKEQEVFKYCMQQEVAKSLVHVFLARGGTSKVRGITDQGLKPTKLNTVAVLGGGLMGSGICTALALSGSNVLLKEINQKFLDGGLERIKANLMSSVKKRKMSEKQAMAVFGRVKGTLEYADFKDCDMVIEAVIEDVNLKQQIFKDLEDSCPPHCVLSTNTSTIDINVVYDVVSLAKQIKKTPVVVGNCTGFAVNRVFFPYTMSAMMLLDMGQDPYHVDKVCAEGIVDKPGDLDIATVMSMGFPAYRGGLIHWADYKGAQYIVKRLNDFAKMVPGHAGFFAPCEYLQQCANQGVPLGVGPTSSRL